MSHLSRLCVFITSSEVFVTTADPPVVSIIQEDPDISREEDEELLSVDQEKQLPTSAYADELDDDVVEDDAHMTQQIAQNEQEIQEEEEQEVEWKTTFDLPADPSTPAARSLPMPLAPKPVNNRSEQEKTAVFYKSGQDLDKCLVANSARRVRNNSNNNDYCYNYFYYYYCDYCSLYHMFYVLLVTNA